MADLWCIDPRSILPLLGGSTTTVRTLPGRWAGEKFMLFGIKCHTLLWILYYMEKLLSLHSWSRTKHMGHSGYGLSQWETLHCNVVSHWLNPIPRMIPEIWSAIIVICIQFACVGMICHRHNFNAKINEILWIYCWYFRTRKKNKNEPVLVWLCNAYEITHNTDITVELAFCGWSSPASITDIN